MIYCCLDHVELALDVVVDEYEVAPRLKEINNVDKLPTNCEYCSKQAIYVVENE